MGTNTVTQIAWALGLIHAAAGWLWLWIVLALGLFTGGIGWILLLTPLAGLVLSIVAMNQSDDPKAKQALWMNLTGWLLGWFALLFLLLGRNQPTVIIQQNFPNQDAPDDRTE